jgi:hypothetical protein
MQLKLYWISLASILTAVFTSLLLYSANLHNESEMYLKSMANNAGLLYIPLNPTAFSVEPVPNRENSLFFEESTKETLHFCNISFSLQLNDLKCHTTRKLKILFKTNVSCPYAYPYLEIEINDRFRTTVLAELAGSPTHYSFGNISIPNISAAQTVMVRICSYFKSSIDILTSMDNKKLDLNNNVTEVEAVLMDWVQAIPWPGSQNSPPKALDCAPSPGAKSLVAGKNETKCVFSQYTPGFWDTLARVFLPTGCTYRLPPRLEKRFTTSGRAWVLFLGDSNMRNLYHQACQRIRSPKVHMKNTSGSIQTQFSTRVCLSPGGEVALAYSASWMSGPGSDLNKSPELLGKPLGPLLCQMAPSTGCVEAWNRTADRTLALVGSHYPEQSIPRARADVRAWLDGIAARLPQRPGALAVLLVNSVCVGKFRAVPQYFSQLFQRNNYRLCAVNDATLVAARELGATAADLFSVSLAAGCGAKESKDVVHFHRPVYAAQAAVVASLLADVL